MISRQEFIEYFRSLDARIDGDDPLSPLWVPEEHGQITCQCFVCIKPIQAYKFKSKYYQWCRDTLNGETRCFSTSSESQQEWWGFTDPNDVPVWLLKWAT